MKLDYDYNVTQLCTKKKTLLGRQLSGYSTLNEQRIKCLS